MTDRYPREGSDLIRAFVPGSRGLGQPRSPAATEYGYIRRAYTTRPYRAATVRPESQRWSTACLFSLFPSDCLGCFGRPCERNGQGDPLPVRLQRVRNGRHGGLFPLLWYPARFYLQTECW